MKIIKHYFSEFSSERGPKMLRTLRNFDRLQNEYPKLDFSQLYLLKSGYKVTSSSHYSILNWLLELLSDHQIVNNWEDLPSSHRRRRSIFGRSSMNAAFSDKHLWHRILDGFTSISVPLWHHFSFLALLYIFRRSSKTIRSTRVELTARWCTRIKKKNTSSTGRKRSSSPCPRKSPKSASHFLLQTNSSRKLFN